MAAPDFRSYERCSLLKTSFIHTLIWVSITFLTFWQFTKGTSVKTKSDPILSLICVFIETVCFFKQGRVL